MQTQSTLTAFILSAIVLSPNHALARNGIVAESLRQKRTDRKLIADTLAMLSDSAIGILTLDDSGAYRIADDIVRDIWRTESLPVNTATVPPVNPNSPEALRLAEVRKAIESLQREGFMATYTLTEEDMGEADIASLFSEYVTLHPIEPRDLEGYCADRNVTLTDLPIDSDCFADLEAYRKGEDIGAPDALTEYSDSPEDFDTPDALTEYSDSPEDFDIDDESELAEYDSAE